MACGQAWHGASCTGTSMPSRSWLAGGMDAARPHATPITGSIAALATLGPSDDAFDTHPYPQLHAQSGWPSRLADQAPLVPLK